MAVIRSGSSSGNSISRKASTTKVTVQSTKPVRELQDATDVDFGTLYSTKDGLVVSYNNTTGKFVLVDSDTILTRSSEDSNVPTAFIDQLEAQLDLGEITQTDLDGGAF